MENLAPIGGTLAKIRKRVSGGAASAGTDISPTRPEETPNKHSCRICEDTRFVHPRTEGGQPDYGRVVPCTCAAEEQKRRHDLYLLKQCELPAGTEHMTFEETVTRRGLGKAISLARDIAEEKSTRWLTLQGDTSRGKTHISIAVCRRWLERGRPAKYVYVPLLFDELRRGFGAEGDNSYDARFQMYLNIPLLVLDDLGVEHKTSWIQERLDTIVDYRLAHNLAMVVTTNCPMEEINFRIQARLERGGDVVFLDLDEFPADRMKVGKANK